MATKILVPELGESVLEATVGRWLKNEGEPVSVGEPLVELETEKVDLEVGAEKSGVLARIEKPQGADVRIGDVLGVIEESASAGVSPALKSGPKQGEPQAATVESRVEKAPELRAPSPETRASNPEPQPRPPPAGLRASAEWTWTRLLLTIEASG